MLSLTAEGHPTPAPYVIDEAMTEQYHWQEPNSACNTSLLDIMLLGFYSHILLLFAKNIKIEEIEITNCS